jgi:hypothetical protein
MKKVLKALTVAAAFMVLQGGIASMPTSASAQYIPPDSIINWHVGLDYSQFIGKTAQIANFSGTPAQPFVANQLQVSGLSHMAGLVDVLKFTGGGVVDFNALDPTRITGNAGGQPTVSDRAGWRCAGAMVTPAPRPRRDGDFAAFIEGAFDISNIDFSWDFGASNAPGADVQAVGLFAALGGITGDLSVASVKSGWVLKKTTVGALNTASAGPSLRMMMVDLDPSVDVIVAERAPVPEPSTILLLGGGLAGLSVAGIRRRRNSVSK